MNARNKTGMLCKAVEHIAKDYPEHRGVIGFKIGKDKAVMAVNAESLKEMMNNEDFDGRPTGLFYETRTWGLRRGVLLTDEQFWQEQRRFIVRHLKEFGFARKGMTEIIQNEAAQIRKDFEDLVAQGNGTATVQMQGAFSVYVLNTLWLMMAGVRYSKDNSDLRYLQSLLHELFTNIDMMGALFSHFPYLRFVAPRLSGYQQFVEIHECMHKFIGAEVERHQQNFNPDDEPRDLMDVYLRTLQNNNAPSDSFSREQLLAVCLDMFIAGSETTTKTLDFSFLYIVRNPQVMRRIQDEIDDVIGRNRLPTMPYCEATTLEGLRLFMSNTFGIPHRALKDTTLCGYNIPKVSLRYIAQSRSRVYNLLTSNHSTQDTMLVGMFRGMMLDENLWEKPTEFNPARFLKDGKIHIPAQYHPFGVGKHRCMGELMARGNLFLFLTTTLQSFDLLLPEGAPIPSDIPVDGATPSVRKYHVAIRPR
uniref:Uncharacterized protein n=1 Tax=Anopheles stephensi TaxID=30069 RepID=A0A182YQN3_ANOST